MCVCHRAADASVDVSVCLKGFDHVSEDVA